MVYVFLADGFEEVEALTPIDLMRRAEIEVRTVSIMNRREVVGAHQVPVVADELYGQSDYDGAELLLLPGGMPGTTNLGQHEPLCQILRSHNAKGGLLAAICAAPSVLGRLGLLEGKQATCYPGFEDALGNSHVDDYVVCSDNVITARGAGVSVDFAHAIISRLRGVQAADQVLASIQCR
ncbi:MAG: DJ-1/PfpI family protein [Paludibacteraceae bacterium]|nr:DJ-1/PfpI family protein [Paludibacteraceae bacterium]